MQLTSCDAQATSTGSLRTSLAATAGRKLVAESGGPTKTVEPGAPVLSVRPSPASLFGPVVRTGNSKKKKVSTAPKMDIDTARQGEKDPVKTRPAPAARPRSPRKENGQFLAPFKKIIGKYKELAGNPALVKRLEESDLAHRMSFQDIYKLVDSNDFDSGTVDDLIRTLTIPSRSFGSWETGDERLYRFVKEKVKDKQLLVKVLNSSPFNLRPGDASKNRSIGKHLDPNLDASGRITPLSRSLCEFGEKHSGSLTPPLPFDAAIHDFPVGVSTESLPNVRSSTSVTEMELASYEMYVCTTLEALVRGNLGGAFRPRAAVAAGKIK